MSHAALLRPRRGARRLSHEERELWRLVTRDVRPLGEAEEEEEVPTGVSPEAPPAPPAAVVRPGGAVPASPPVPAPPLPELTHGSGIDRRTEARLKRGQVTIEARIDLHGMTQEQAHPALAHFLATSVERGRKCVLVITGKGLREDGEVGVLRRQVPQWLNRLRHLVHGFHYARQQDGGTGALYVLLRRKR